MRLAKNLSILGWLLIGLNVLSLAGNYDKVLSSGSTKASPLGYYLGLSSFAILGALLILSGWVIKRRNKKAAH